MNTSIKKIKGLKRHWKNLLSIIVGAVLLGLAPKPINLQFIVWFAMVPIFFYMIAAKNKKTFFAYAIIYSLVYLNMISRTLWAIFPWYFIISAILSVSLFFIGGLILSYYFSKLHIYLAPFAFIIVDAIRQRLIFGGGIIGYYITDFSLIWQLGSITGVHGVTFLIVLVNVFIAKQIYDKKVNIKEVAIISTIFLLVMIYGFININRFDKNPDRLVGMIQPTFTSVEKAYTERVDKYFDIQKDLTSKLPDDIELLLWPETAINQFINKIPEYKTNKLPKIAKEKEAVFVVGVSDWLEEVKRTANSAYVFDSDGKYIDKYIKQKLIPLLESVPFPQKLSNFMTSPPMENFLRKYFQEIYWRYAHYTFYSGNEANNIMTRAGNLGISICYDSTAPNNFRKQTKQGATVLTSITSSATLGDSMPTYITLDMSQMRAVENGRYLIRNDNFGPSTIIYPDGSIAFQAEPEERTILLGKYRELTHKTIYTQYGEWFVWFCVIICSVGVIYRRSIKKD
ncbi:MAG: apolipoprotein N-acyltransferase [bacterium]